MSSVYRAEGTDSVLWTEIFLQGSPPTASTIPVSPEWQDEGAIKSLQLWGRYDIINCKCAFLHKNNNFYEKRK